MDEFGNRFSAAKQIRQAQIEGPAREVYKFCFNGRETEWDATQPKTYDPEEIFTDVPATALQTVSAKSRITPEISKRFSQRPNGPKSCKTKSKTPKMAGQMWFGASGPHMKTQKILSGAQKSALKGTLSGLIKT
jgi:hypothetical protein